MTPEACISRVPCLFQPTPVPEPEDDGPGTERCRKFLQVIDMAACESLACIKRYSGIGRPPKDRVAMARAFAARAVWNLPTTSALPDRLRVDKSRRRMCGRVFSSEGPSEATSWRAFRGGA